MDLNTRCTNESWGTTRCEPMLDRHGNDVAVVVSKVAYSVSPAGRVSLVYRPVRTGDIQDERGGLRYPSDLADDKPGTDVVLVGTSRPPRGKSIDRQLAWLSVGPLRKVVQVFGRRLYTADFSGVVPGPPATLGETPLRYDLAFGGIDRSGGGWADEPHNPLGRGFALDPKSLIGTEAPRLEPVADPRTGRVPHPSHGCFAPIPPDWEPRRSLVGTHDLEWVEKRAPVRPRDFSTKHHLFAVPELHSDEPLTGDEPFEVGGVLAEGLWKFQLPRYAFSFFVKLATDEAPRELSTHLDTVLVDADERVVELVYRASFVLPRKWELLERVIGRGVGTMPDEVLEVDARGSDARSEARGSPAPP